MSVGSGMALSGRAKAWSVIRTGLAAPPPRFHPFLGADHPSGRVLEQKVLAITTKDGNRTQNPGTSIRIVSC
jgi:hypothetical protein